MGGFGSVFALATVGIVILVSWGALAKASTAYLTLIADAELQTKGQSNPSITSGYMKDPTTCFVNVTMCGSKSVPINKMRLADVIVVYNSDGGRHVARLQYGSSWMITRVFVGENLGDLVNPIDVTRETGLWDPGETIELQLSLPSQSDNRTWWFSIMLPDGGSCSWTFS